MLARRIFRLDGGDARDEAHFVATIVTSGCGLSCTSTPRPNVTRRCSTARAACTGSSRLNRDEHERLDRAPEPWAEAVVKVRKRHDRLTTRSAYSTRAALSNSPVRALKLLTPAFRHNACKRCSHRVCKIEQNPRRLGTAHSAADCCSASIHEGWQDGQPCTALPRLGCRASSRDRAAFHPELPSSAQSYREPSNMEAMPGTSESRKRSIIGPNRLSKPSTCSRNAWLSALSSCVCQ